MIVTGLVVFAVLLRGFALAFNLLSSDAVLQGVVGSTAGGVAGVGGLAAAFALRIRSLPPFGFRRASPRWLAVAFVVGIGGYGPNCIIQQVYAAAFAYDDPQGSCTPPQGVAWSHSSCLC